MKKWIGLLIVILLAVGGWWATWFFGDRAPATFDFSSLIELERMVIGGSA